MKRFAILALVVIAAASAAACNNPNAPPGNYGSIGGTIKSTSGAPIANAIVVVDNVIQAQQPSAANGAYTVNYVPVTDALSPASAGIPNPPSGYSAPAPQTNIQVTAGQTTQVNFTLSPL